MNFLPLAQELCFVTRSASSMISRAVAFCCRSRFNTSVDKMALAAIETAKQTTRFARLPFERVAHQRKCIAEIPLARTLQLD